MNELNIKNGLIVDGGATGHSMQFTTELTQTSNVGQLVWNNADGTLDLGLKGGSVTLQIGQEHVARVVNKTSPLIDLLEANYQVVKIKAATGQRLSVDLAVASGLSINSETTLGVVTETISRNQEGFITVLGQVKKINTTGSLQGETWNDGDVLYLSDTVPGQLTKIKPQSPNHNIRVAIVEYAHANNGKLYVNISNGFALTELDNVIATGATNNDILKYNASTQTWINSNSISLSNISATTISATTYQNLPIDIRVTGGTYSSGTAIFTNNTGGTFSVSGFSTGSGSGSSSSIVVGSTVISSGTTGRIPFNNGGIYGESGNLVWDNTNSRLGLGGIAPNYNFSIMRNAPNTFVGMQISNNSSGTAGSDGLLIGIGTDNNARIETGDANSIIISSNSTGKLQVGTTGTQFFGTLTNTSPNTGAIFQVNGNSSTSGLGFFQLRNNGGTPVLCANENGKVSINLGSVGTAQFHIGAGSTAANTAPIKINSGPLMTTPEPGTIEYNNTFYVTNSDSTRRHIVTAPNTTKVTAGAPYTNDGYIIVNIGGTDFKLMTTA